MFVGGVALAVADGVGPPAPGGKRCRRPELARVVVTQIERLARRIPHRVVAPGRQAVAVAVLGPGEAWAQLGGDEPERRVRDHVRPWRWRDRPVRLVDVDDVLAPAVREPA